VTRLDALVEIYRMMRPGEPPTKEAAENLFHNLFFNAERYDISSVGRMKFNRRVGRTESTGPGVLTREDIIDALRTLMEIRNGRGQVDDIDHLGNRRGPSVEPLAENPFRVGLARSVGGNNFSRSRQNASPCVSHASLLPRFTCTMLTPACTRRLAISSDQPNEFRP